MILFGIIGTKFLEIKITPEGRLVFGAEAETFTRKYYPKDHLGKNRVVFSDYIV